MKLITAVIFLGINTVIIASRMVVYEEKVRFVQKFLGKAADDSLLLKDFPGPQIFFRKGHASGRQSPVSRPPPANPSCVNSLYLDSETTPPSVANSRGFLATF